MLRNNQMSLIVLLIIIGVTLYLLSCNSNSDKPLKNLGNLEVSGLNAEGNEMISEVNDEVLNRIIDDSISQDENALSDEGTVQEIRQEEMIPQPVQHMEHKAKHHVASKQPSESEISLDKYFDNCDINGGNLYNDNNFAPAESNAEGASLSAAFKPTPLNPNTCTDCIDFNGSSNNPNTKYNSKEYLPQEVHKSWFETDFSNAEYDVNNNKLINTDKFAIGINTVGQSLKNPSYDIRGTIPCPKITVSPWLQSTIEPDFNIASLY